MSTNKGRILTLVVEIQTNEYPNWIMDAHVMGPQNDVRVLSIFEGNEIRKLEDKLQDTYYESMGEDL